jgi:hypothetical protein
MMNERTAGRISEARTVAMSRGGGFLAEAKAARVIYLTMWCRRAMMMMTRIGSYLFGLGIFSAVDAERRSELPSQYTAAASRWHAHLNRVEHATRDEARRD